MDGFIGMNLPGMVLPCNTDISPKVLNHQQTVEIYNRFVNMALSRFKWSGLPESCNESALE